MTLATVQNRWHGRQSKSCWQTSEEALEVDQVRIMTAGILVEAKKMERNRMERINSCEVIICPVNMLVFILSI